MKEWDILKNQIPKEQKLRIGKIVKRPCDEENELRKVLIKYKRTWWKQMTSEQIYWTLSHPKYKEGIVSQALQIRV